MDYRYDDRREVAYVDDPPVARRLLAETGLAWVWLIPRAYLGVIWFITGTSLIMAAAFAEEQVRPGFDPTLALTLAVTELTIGLLFFLGAFTGMTAIISAVLSFNPLFPGPVASGL